MSEADGVVIGMRETSPPMKLFVQGGTRALDRAGENPYDGEKPHVERIWTNREE